MMEETQQAAPAYKTRSRTRFRSLTQEAMLAFVETAQLKSTPENLARRKLPIQILNTVLYEETGELM